MMRVSSSSSSSPIIRRVYDLVMSSFVDPVEKRSLFSNKPSGMILIMAAASSSPSPSLLFQKRRSFQAAPYSCWFGTKRSRRRRRTISLLSWIPIVVLWLVVLKAPASQSFVLISTTDSSASFASQRHPASSKPSTSSTTTQLDCQLLGMNCATPTSFALSWPDFCQRGGGTDVHADGWGLAYYIGQGLRQFHDVEAASTSQLAAFLGQQPIQTNNMLAHIRYATTGEVDLCNVHPFAREMWAMNWCFCHNGQVPLFEDHPDAWLGGGGGGEIPGDRVYFPVGHTDSEATFCAILNALRAEFTDTMPSLPVLYERLQTLCQEIVNYNPKETILNFLLTCGPHVLWVYSWPGRRPGSAVWNGLHYTVRSQSGVLLKDADYSVVMSNTAANKKNGAAAADDDNDDDGSHDVCIVATKPLTSDEEWIELSPGELILLDSGKPHVSPRELFHVELQGHGLVNDGKALKPARLEEDMRRYEFHKEFFVGGGI